MLLFWTEKWVILGCWIDVVGARALPHFYQETGIPYPEPDSENNLKPIYDSCKAGAEKKDYCYFGLQFKKECWGGEEVNQTNLKTSGFIEDKGYMKQFTKLS